MKAKEAIEQLRAYDPEEEVCMILWERSDVSMWAEDQVDYKDLTVEDIDAILLTIERKHDASVGITWDTIDYAIHYHLSHDKEKCNQE